VSCKKIQQDPYHNSEGGRKPHRKTRKWRERGKPGGIFEK
jgi:hypothetical protein